MNVTFKSDRCIMRLVTMDDAENIYALHSEQAVARFNTLPIPGDVSEIRPMVEEAIDACKQEPPASYMFCIEWDGRFIGLMGMIFSRPRYKAAELYCKLLPTYWNRGFATEVLTATLRFGFNQLKLHRISAGCAVENTSSWKVMEKCGMIREGMQRKSLPLQEGWHDTYEYAILESDKRR